MLRQGELVISAECRDIIREFYLYCWKEDSLTDCPVKENDHAMDDMRYFVNTYIPRDKAENSFFAASLARG
jgi:phage terminase large subunit